MVDKQLTLYFGPKTDFDDMIDRFLSTTSTWWLIGNDQAKAVVKSDLCNAFEQIEELSDLNEKLFWKQVNAIRRKYANDPEKRIRGLRGTVYFYIYIIKHHPELKLFEESRTLFPALLENRSFVTEWLESGCSFLTFSPNMHYDGHEQYILIIRGAGNESVKLKDIDYKKVDLSSINSPFYRKCVFEYICSSIDKLKNFNPSAFNVCLNLLTELKQQDNYKNKSESFLIVSEISLMNEGIHAKFSGNEITQRQYKASFKALLLWCVENKYIQVDNNVFDEFKHYTGKKYISKTKRPEAYHVDAVLDASKRKVEQEPSKIVFDTILRLLLETKLRVSEICGLKRDCIESQLKPNTYRIKYISKTSHGCPSITSITLRDKTLLEKVMAYNEPLVSKANTENKNDIFIYIPDRKKYVRTVDKFAFRLYLQEICKENSIPPITAAGLRKEYQSQVSRHVRENKLDDAQYKALSGHAHIDTTEKNYVTARFEEYFQELYMIQLHEEELNIEGTIVESVPSTLEKVGDTTHKCGACNASECVIKNALPCFVCKDFITSVEFLPVFRTMIDEIDNRIISSPNAHDKEDLTAVKEILVKYVIELSRLS